MPSHFRLPLCLAALVVSHAIVQAQRSAIDPPLEGKPLNFSDIVGKYSLSATAAPTVVEVEQPITLRVVIIGEGPAKYEPRRESLRILPPAWDKDFYVEEMHDQHTVDRAAKTWTFVYRLRPKHARIDAIEGIKLVYYDPEARGNKKFLSSSEEPIKIAVRPKADDPPPIVLSPIAPESFYQHVPLVLTNASGIPREYWLSLLAVVAVAAPIACILAAFLWRRFHPDDFERRRRLRSRAADQALSSLRAPGTSVWQTISRYLHERLDFTREEPTPAEVVRFLLKRGFAKELCRQWEQLLQDCDAMRYAEERPAAGSTIETAARLIAALEADPCAR